MITFETTVTNVENLNWAEGIIVPESVAKQLFAATDRKRFVATINGLHSMACGVIPLGGQYMLYLSQERRKEWGIEPGDRLTVTLAVDESKYGFPLPEEWRELMAMDPEVDEYFHALTPGQQRNMLHRIGTAKRPETRVKRAVQIADYLRDNQGNFDYAELAAYVKRANRR